MSFSNGDVRGVEDGREYNSFCGMKFGLNEMAWSSQEVYDLVGFISVREVVYLEAGNLSNSSF